VFLPVVAMPFGAVAPGPTALYIAAPSSPEKLCRLGKISLRLIQTSPKDVSVPDRRRVVATTAQQERK